MKVQIGGMPPLQTVAERRAAYDEAFRREAAVEYPLVDALEQRMGYAVERARLLEAARVLACPLKVNPPNWQHGRVLYAVARQYLASVRRRVMLLDIGTAKGFSALCLRWAMRDSGVEGNIVSVDVIDPRNRVNRNTVAELDGSLTLTETLAPWPEADAIAFQMATGVDFLSRYQGRIEIAFVDGKHTGETVWKEGLLLADRQLAGDLVIFDDLQISGVRDAVSRLRAYNLEFLRILPNRGYAIGRRK